MNSPVLEVRGLVTEFPTRHGVVRATRDVDLEVQRGEVLGLVGESGSGKTVVLRSILGLLKPPGRVVSGEVIHEGRDLRAMNRRDLDDLRGGSIGFVPQDPINAFNPVLNMGYQITRPLKRHRRSAPTSGWDVEAEALLERVGISPGGKLRQHSFNFSQGQLQRVMMAIATLAGRPTLLLADEPTTSLDVTVEAQILWLIKELQHESGMAVVFVTHDLGVVAQLADRIAVMYAGSVVEQGSVLDLFADPRHPYTIGLLRSSRGFSSGGRHNLYALPGAPPDLRDVRPGCPFAPRCSWASSVCRDETPMLRAVGSSLVACHHAENTRVARE
jgi:oligopeptide/dipeptide ABC transporter ATP-binding protein